VASDDVFQSKQSALEIQRIVTAAVDVGEEIIHVVGHLSPNHSWSAISDDFGGDEFADLVAPLIELFKMAGVEWVQPRKEVSGVSLVDFVEDFVEVNNHLFEFCVSLGESKAAEVAHESAGAGMEEKRLEGDGAPRC